VDPVVKKDIDEKWHGLIENPTVVINNDAELK